MKKGVFEKFQQVIHKISKAKAFITDIAHEEEKLTEKTNSERNSSLPLSFKGNKKLKAMIAKNQISLMMAKELNNIQVMRNKLETNLGLTEMEGNKRSLQGISNYEWKKFEKHQHEERVGNQLLSYDFKKIIDIVQKRFKNEETKNCELEKSKQQINKSLNQHHLSLQKCKTSKSYRKQIRVEKMAKDSLKCKLKKLNLEKISKLGIENINPDKNKWSKNAHSEYGFSNQNTKKSFKNANNLSKMAKNIQNPVKSKSNLNYKFRLIKKNSIENLGNSSNNKSQDKKNQTSLRTDLGPLSLRNKKIDKYKRFKISTRKSRSFMKRKIN